MKNKLATLIDIIAKNAHLALALSGGVDSIFLLKAASLALPPEKLLAVTAQGPFFPKREARDAAEAASSLGIRHLIITFNALAEELVAANPIDRCYHCKKALFSLMRQETAKQGFHQLADGGNLDDLNDYRPGAKAVEEMGIISPLKLAALTKADIRLLSAELGLSSWNKPAFACLASRIPYGQFITSENLERIEKAEEYLLKLGFKQVRVRTHGRLARVEVAPEERSKFFQAEFMDEADRHLKNLGFMHVALDLAGYQTGSLNNCLSEHEQNIYIYKKGHLL